MVTEQKEYDIRKKRGAIDYDLGTDYNSTFHKISNMLKEDEDKFREDKKKAQIKKEKDYVRKVYKGGELGLDKNSSRKEVFLGMVTYSDKLTKEGEKLARNGEYEKAYSKYDESRRCLTGARENMKYMYNDAEKWKMLEKRFVRVGNDMVYIAEHQKDKSVKEYLRSALDSFNNGSRSLGQRRRILEK